jgi:AcrR family transcriptional regulator
LSVQPAKKRKRVSKDPEIRREELLEAASTLFRQKGIAATGIGDITDHAKVARGTFYLYFSSKDAVVSELWKRYVDGFMSIADEVQSSRSNEGTSVILELMARLTRHALDHAHLHRLVYGTADAAAIALCKQSDEAILGRLAQVIRAHFRRVRRKGGNIELLATLVFNGLDGTLHRAIMQNAPIEREVFIGEIVRFTANVLQLSSRSESKDAREPQLTRDLK